MRFLCSFFLFCLLARSWGSGARSVDAGMFGRIEETYQKYKRPDGYEFLKEARSVGIPVLLDSGTYRYAFAESRDNTEAPAKRVKTLSGQTAESFEFQLARSVRRLGESYHVLLHLFLIVVVIISCIIFMCLISYAGWCVTSESSEWSSKMPKYEFGHLTASNLCFRAWP